MLIRGGFLSPAASLWIKLALLKAAEDIESF